MQLTQINGRTVTPICLGTMTWGEQNTEAEAHSQIDYALERGINFMDCAEMYPVPPKPETQGLTEQYIGNWFAKTGRREDWVLATKAAGPGNTMEHLRGGPRHTRPISIRRSTTVFDAFKPITSICISCTGRIAIPIISANWVTFIKTPTRPPSRKAWPRLRNWLNKGRFVKLACLTRRPGAPCGFCIWRKQWGYPKLLRFKIPTTC